MIMCVLLCYPVSIRIYYQQGVLFLVVAYCSHSITLNYDLEACKCLYSDDLHFGYCTESDREV